jgi:hypothetical protein
MQHIILIKDSFFTVSCEEKDFLDEIYELFTFADPSKAYTRSGFKKEKIAQIRFTQFIDVEIPTLKIPIGFLYIVKNIFKEQNLDFKIIDERKPLEEVKLSRKLVGVDLRDYQISAAERAMNKRRGIIRAPTGSGKCISGDTEITIEYNDNEIKI